MKNRLMLSIERYCELLLYKKERSVYSGLMEGEVGLLVCNAYLYKIYEDEKYFSRCSNLLEDLLNKHSNNYTLGYGLAGMAWGIYILKLQGMLTNDFDAWFDNTDNLLRNAYYQMIEHNNFDYFSGATGILNYFLQKDTTDSYCEEMVNVFCRKIEDLTVDYFFSAKPEKDPQGCTHNILNLGVPHGVTGIILLLLKLEEKKGLKLNLLLSAFVHKLWTFRNKEDTQFMFYSLLGDIERGSTLAWCYGDLPILYLLTRITRIAKEGEQFLPYLNVLHNKIINRDDCQTDNLTLCHGLTIISYLYYKLWKQTSDETYYVIYQNWKLRTDELWRKQISKDGNIENIFLNDSSLFNGISGFMIVTLTINGCISDSWDSILLL